MPFRLYQSDNTTPVTIPQPEVATWKTIDRPAFSDGGKRKSAFVTVEWRFKAALSAADFQLLTTYRPDSGKLQFETWKKPVGAVAGQFVKCEGIMDEPEGVERDGRYNAVAVRFTGVRQVA